MEEIISLSKRHVKKAEHVVPLPIDCIVLCGTHKEPSHLIKGQNKGLLPVQGKPMVRHVVEAVMASAATRRIAVVGPAEKLDEVFADLHDEILIVQEKSGIVANTLAGYYALIGSEQVIPHNPLLEEKYRFKKGRCKKALKLDILAHLANAQHENRRGQLSEKEVQSIIRTRVDRWISVFRKPRFYLTKYILLELIETKCLYVQDGFLRILDKTLLSFLREYHQRLNQPVLLVTADAPFVLPATIEDFLLRCDNRTVEIGYGLVAEESIAPFLPTEVPQKRRGLLRPLITLREGRFRAANLCLGRPGYFASFNIFEDVFSARKFTTIPHIIKMLVLIGKSIKLIPRGLPFYLSSHIVSLLYRGKYRREAEALRQYLSLDTMGRLITKFFLTRFDLIPIQLGGVSVDADTEEDYEIIQENFEYWKKSEIARSKLPEVLKLEDLPKEIRSKLG